MPDGTSIGLAVVAVQVNSVSRPALAVSVCLSAKSLPRFKERTEQKLTAYRRNDRVPRRLCLPPFVTLISFGLQLQPAEKRLSQGGKQIKLLFIELIL